MRLAWLISIGSGLGGLARLSVASLADSLLGHHFPLGLLSVNVLGSFAIGLIATLTAAGARYPLRPVSRQSLTVGFCGGFTTFSFFSLQTMDLLAAGRTAAALLYASLTLALSLAAVAAGWAAGSHLSRQP
jgi:fluoride exporter